ncbi:SUMF1/EgtB/PvdO family nonheme iron enzyme [Rhizobium leguminosarum bv. viciae]|nr:SUMF1/EgtB/PvdO family nonheme iron enzyme [Rhizobium leguminosarum bv. viciae]NKL56855.1 SUMF1/EgtB/PvdO family nonheme iron enzyme [Rhizobium leguminosarum bv. viciae]
MVQTLIPAVLLAVLATGVVQQSGLLAAAPADAALYEPRMVVIQPRQFSYRADGEYLRGSYVIDAPMVTVTETQPLTIMKYQVSIGDYDACVADNVCKPPEGITTVQPNLPVTGVSYDNAQAYAAWLSMKTGSFWTLPSDRQLAFAAGTSFPDDALGLDPDSNNPAIRWLADYRREAAERSKRDPAPRILGSFGENEYGLADFGGNVWEWTDTCHRRVQLKEDGSVNRIEPTCGVYVTVGNHRSPMTSFVRDPKGGGCAVGTPPDNLGFRLVKSTRWYAPLLNRLRDKGIQL